MAGGTQTIAEGTVSRRDGSSPATRIQQQHHQTPGSKVRRRRRVLISFSSLHRQLVQSAGQFSLQRLKNMPPKTGHQYVPTDPEHIANIVSHLIMIPAAFYRMFGMLNQATNRTQAVISILYGASGIGLFLVSSLFHTFSYCGGPRALRELFHRGDRVFIYVFIAASYTPWLLLRDYELNMGIWCMYAIWTAAVMGIVYQLVYHEKHKWLDVALYLLVGIIPGLVVGMQMKNPAGLAEMAFGGAVYVSGVIFFKLDGIVPFAHAIWHLFVVAGSVVHFDAVATHLYGRAQEFLAPNLSLCITQRL